MPTFVRAVNDDPDLALRAAANPLLALEELGYALTDKMRRYAEHRVRFTEEDAARLTKLGDQIDKLAGDRVDLQSQVAIVRALGGVGVKVKVPKDRATQSAPAQAVPTRSRGQSTARSVARQPPGREPVLPPDDTRRLLPVLEPLVGRHPIVEPLVAYLTLDTTQPRLALPEVYEALRARKEDPSRTEVAVRFVLRNRDDG
jgi:hypothetical protein